MCDGKNNQQQQQQSLLTMLLSSNGEDATSFIIGRRTQRPRRDTYWVKFSQVLRVRSDIFNAMNMNIALKEIKKKTKSAQSTMVVILAQISIKKKTNKKCPVNCGGYIRANLNYNERKVCK